MERMTGKAGGMQPVPTTFRMDFVLSMDDKTYKAFMAMVARLYEYEDTGMEPEEINDLREFCENQTSTTLAHIYELVQAEREGRLVVTHITEKTRQAMEDMAAKAHSGEGEACP